MKINVLNSIESTDNKDLKKSVVKMNPCQSNKKTLN